MPTLDQWQYIQSPDGGVVLTGILGDDTRGHLFNGGRIYTNTIVSVGIHRDSPVAVTKSGTAYRLLNPAADPRDTADCQSRTRPPFEPTGILAA
jgi:hypothetical protein